MTCGAHIDGNARFCTRCGRPLHTPEQQAAVRAEVKREGVIALSVVLSTFLTMGVTVLIILAVIIAFFYGIYMLFILTLSIMFGGGTTTFYYNYEEMTGKTVRIEIAYFDEDWNGALGTLQDYIIVSRVLDDEERDEFLLGLSEIPFRSNRRSAGSLDGYFVIIYYESGDYEIRSDTQRLSYDSEGLLIGERANLSTHSFDRIIASFFDERSVGDGALWTYMKS